MAAKSTPTDSRTDNKILTLKNVRSFFATPLIKLAEKSKIRECDEIEAGAFQAYVDEAKESYDVALTINKKDVIVAHSCDCNTTVAFCHHKIALLLFITKEKRTKEGPKKKKQTPLEAALENLDPQILKNWLKETFLKNKELEFSFLIQFAPKQQEFTPEEIKIQTIDAVKAIAKRKRKLEAIEVKKIVELWQEAHAAFLEHFYTQPHDKPSFQCFHTLIETCMKISFEKDSTSVRIQSYVETMMKKAGQSIHELQNETSWDKATEYFLEELYPQSQILNYNYLQLLSTLEQMTTGARKEQLSRKLLKYYQQYLTEEKYPSTSFANTMLRIAINAELFAEHYSIFKPLRFENAYNSILLEALLKLQQFNLVEKYCKEQMQGNYHPEYNIEYLKCLRKLYIAQNKDENLKEIIRELLPLTFNFNDYLIFCNNSTEAQIKEFRTRVMTRARHATASNIHAAVFSFRVMDQERNYVKMLDYLSKAAPYAIIVEFAEKMIVTDKLIFLKTLLFRDDVLYNNASEEKDAVLFKRLADIIRIHYSIEIINLVFLSNNRNSYQYYNRNRFAAYLRKELAL